MAEVKPITLPVGSAGTRSTGWWGLWMLVLTEASLFGYLLFSYFYLMLQTPQDWPPEGPPGLLVPGVNTVILLSSSGFVMLSERGVLKKRKGFSLLMMGIAIALGIAFVAVQCGEWAKKPYGISSNLYGSLYYTITGFHMAHVVVGLIVLSLVALWTALDYFSPERYPAMKMGGIYWHFVDVVWLFVFTSFYLVPYLQVW